MLRPARRKCTRLISCRDFSSCKPNLRQPPPGSWATGLFAAPESSSERSGGRRTTRQSFRQYELNAQNRNGRLFNAQNRNAGPAIPSRIISRIPPQITSRPSIPSQLNSPPLDALRIRPKAFETRKETAQQESKDLELKRLEKWNKANASGTVKSISPLLPGV